MSALREWLLHRVWYVHPPVVLNIQAAPTDCLRVLHDSTRPNLKRLELRDLFRDGRRYYLYPAERGFQLTMDTSLPWGQRRRSAMAALLNTEFSPLSGGNLQLQMRAQIRLVYLLDVFPVPVFMTSILIFAPWQPWGIAFFIGLLFGLSWMWHRLSAMLQAADMVFFVQKVLQDVPTVEIAPLGEAAPDVVTLDADFAREWQRFYAAHQDDPPE
jgi:hypothetical protein